MDYTAVQEALTVKANAVSEQLTDDLIQRYVRILDYIKFQKTLNDITSHITEDDTTFIGPANAQVKIPLSKYLLFLLNQLNMSDTDVIQLQADLDLVIQVEP